jgi:multidrug resistance efflux pump
MKQRPMDKSWIRVAAAAVGSLSLLTIAARELTSNPSVPAVQAAAPEPKAGSSAAVVAASPGRVEGRSETISVGAAADGVVQAIYVHEGEPVKEGARLAEIGCSDLHSALEVARAEAESVRQARARLLRGSREEERDAAAQRTLAAQAVMEHASAELNRAKQLSEAAAISKAAYDQAKRDSEVANAALHEALRNQELVNAGPTAEDIAKSDADLRAAEDRIKLAEQKVSKCVVRAPATGTVLRVNLREGESFSTLAPHPLFAIADLSSRRVRAEVDERDISRVFRGQEVVVSSESYPGKRFVGNVEQLASQMGRKTVQSGDPADKSDRDILEAIVDLGPGAEALPMGLRVTVQFLR